MIILRRFNGYFKLQNFVYTFFVYEYLVHVVMVIVFGHSFG